MKIKGIIKKILRILNINDIVKVSVSQIEYGKILDGKKVLVTGGSSGIGYATAKKCLGVGAKVVITGRNNDKLKKASEGLNSENVFILKWDASDILSVDEMIDKASNLMGGLDIIFNNAGVYTDKQFMEIDEENFDNVMSTNIKGLFFIAKGVAKYFIENNQKGKIINITSVRGIQGTSEPYGISKWGTIGLTKGLARDLASKGIIVNGIAPGITASGINGIDVSNNAFSSGSLDKRVALPEEIAEIGLFLASDTSNHIIGQIIVCDGGETLI